METGDFAFEENRYMNFTVSFDKIRILYDQLLSKPLLSGDIRQIFSANNYSPVLFSVTSWFTQALVAVFYSILMALILFCVIKRKKNWHIVILLSLALG